MGNRSSKSLRIVVWLIALGVPLVAQQPERARTEALARRASERLQSLQREADRFTTQERTLIGDLRKLELERQIKAEELKQLDADAAKIEGELGGISARMEALQQSERESRPELSARLVEIYKLGQARYLRLLLSTPDLRRMG
jgi:septal ring factor EnvC (AmiA/AmiB activator)